MNAIVYQGLACTWENRQGRYLVIRQESGPLPAEELSRLDIKMMQRNSIPHVLPLDLEEINATVTLRYRLPPSRELKQVVAAAPGDLKLILELLHSIVIILEDSNLYMLDSGKYALHPSLILAGVDASDVSLVYLPLRKMEQKPSVRQELYLLALSLLDWAGVPVDTCPVLLDCLKSSLFELSEFKRLLTGLQADSDIPKAPRPMREAGNGYDKPAEPVEHNGSFTPSGECEVRAAAVPLLAPKPSFKSISGKEQLEERLLHDGDTLHLKPGRMILSRPAALRILLAVIAAAWGAAAWKPGEILLLAAAGITIIAVYIYLKWLQKTKAASLALDDLFDNLQDSSLKEPNLYDSSVPSAGHQPREAIGTNQPSRNREDTGGQPQPSGERTFGWSEKQHRLYADNPAHTIILTEKDQAAAAAEQLPATKLLLPVTELLVPAPVVQIMKNGEIAASIALNKDRFRYGRDPQETDLTLNGPGISRIHGEIIREGNEWRVRDLDSRNGTRLNGEPMKAHEAYPLSNGDCVSAAETDFIFRVL
ncbi:MAG: hypothetical protein K0R57_2318 [Paenibacillaceae bacterium]|jgi:hypothetical protein|nr:hypothetical protein [Paenibacillaceae bacterium]